jgi:enoyl-CoA hydratase/long-chain 3-hydroxyacyl-CoA dehydrogenase
VANPDVLALLEKYKRTPVELKTEEIQERLAFRFMNEALWCLQDEIIATPTDGDIGAVFGIGFPPFRGGPFREIDRMGAQTFVDKMNMYTQKYGEHFEPAPIVVEYAKMNKKFHN